MTFIFRVGGNISCWGGSAAVEELLQRLGPYELWAFHPTDFRERYHRRLAGEPSVSMQSYWSWSYLVGPSQSVHGGSHRFIQNSHPPPSPFSGSKVCDKSLTEGVGETE